MVGVSAYPLFESGAQAFLQPVRQRADVSSGQLDVRGLVVAMAPAVAFDVPVEAEGCAVLHLGWEGVRLARRCYLFEEGRNLADLDAIRLENLVEGSVAKTIWLCGWLILFLLWCGSPDACAASPWASAASGV